ncbi:MAG: NAD-dependent epimerase/dehydratase family protein [Chloroflexi bacterium]|nr:NAD-dependent epimerase/dehydratase family protein [Chloroflexota bacterium]
MTDTVLVTGAAGFMGSHLVDALVNLNFNVLAMDDLSGGYRDNVNENAQFIEASVTDHETVNRMFAEHRPKYVYHLAAYAAEGLSHFIRRFNYTNNLIGTVNLLNAAVNYDAEHFVFTSSIAVYGSAPPPMTEDMKPQPEDPYGIAKYACEQDIHQVYDMFKLPYTIFRPHNVYGERQNVADRYRNVIGIFMNQLMQGKALTIFGSGEQSRGFTYVGDVAPVLAQAPMNSDARNEIFNLGADTPVSVNELAREVGDVMGIEPEIRYLPARHEVVHAYAVHKKVRDAFDLPEDYETPLARGLRKMWPWVQEHGARKTPKFKNIEVPKNLPGVWLEE